MRWLVLLLVACGPPPPPTPIENIAPVDPTREKACATGKLAGTLIVRDREHEPAIGATIVATRPSNDGELVTITDENGEFILDKLDAHDTLTLYYEDRQFQAPLPRRCDAVTLEIDVLTKIDRGRVQPIRVK